MWLSFAVGVIACSLLLYLPGFFLFRAIGFDGIRSFALAPLASVFFYCLLGILFSKIGILCTWTNVALPVCALAVIAFVIRIACFRRKGTQEQESLFSSNWIFLLAYVGIGIVITIYVYAVPLGSPEHFLQEFDNAFHMMVVRGFMDSGNWSVLEVGKYMTQADISIDPFSVARFYPALWHLLCAQVGDLLGCSVPFAINVVNFTVASMVFPASMFLLLSTVFSEKTMIGLGAICTLAFIGFPWMLLYWGPLYANAFAFALTPLAAALFIQGLNECLDKSLKARVVLAFFLSVFVLVVAQTSAIFFCVLLLTPYCVWRIWSSGPTIHVMGRGVSRVVAAALFIAFVLIVWSAFTALPFMYDIVYGFNWAAELSPEGAIIAFLQIKDGWIPPQYALAVAVLVGIVSTIRHREHLWLSVAYVVFGMIYVLCASTEGFLKHFLGGFWYTDSYRIFSCLAIVGILLAVIGLSSILGFFQKRLQEHKRTFIAIAGVIVVAFCILVYRPGLWIAGTYFDSSFGKMRWEFTQGNDHSRPHVFTSEEQEFVKEVSNLIPEGALVLNMPDDGSIFAYATDGLRTYYRDYRDYEGGIYTETSNCLEAPVSQLLRKEASHISENEEVRKAFEDLGIRYVLLLDAGDAIEAAPKVGTYDKDLWTGLASITDETPGFSVVLAKDDMRLYEVEW